MKDWTCEAERFRPWIAVLVFVATEASELFDVLELKPLADEVAAVLWETRL